jgi:hypothetical protein
MSNFQEFVPRGLLQWVNGYRKLRLNGNIKLAAAVKKNIDREIKRLGLKSKDVYFNESLTQPIRAQNPVPASKKVQIRNASKLYSDFTGHEADEIETLDKPVMPDVMLRIGEIDFIGYTTIRDEKTEKYIHKFKKKCRPLFTVSHDGKQLFMLGGSYDFTELGIVDKT